MKYFDKEGVLQFIHEIGRAKDLIRTGWREKVQVRAPESVAEHMYRTAVISMVLSDLEGLNTAKVLRMCLLDDLAETITGDLTPTQKRRLDLKEFKKSEERAMQRLLSYLPRSLSEKYIKTWREAQSRRSREASLVKSSDKLEMAIQAREYMAQNYDSKKLRQFIISADKGIDHPQISKLFRVLKGNRRFIFQTKMSRSQSNPYKLESNDK